MKKKLQDNKKSKEVQFVSKRLKNTTVDHDNSAIITFIVALIVIMVLVGGLYFVNAKYVTKDKYQKDETTTTTTEVSYDATIITYDQIFKMSEKEYMVLLYDKSQDNSTYYNSLVSGYKGNSKVYSVDLGNKMNESIYQKDGNVSTEIPADIKDLKVKNPTLLTIKKGKITKIINDSKEIYTEIDGIKFN